MKDYEEYLAMATQMKAKDIEIRKAIRRVQRAQHGVVALRFHDHGTRMEIVILDEPYEDNVRVYEA